VYFHIRTSQILQTYTSSLVWIHFWQCSCALLV